jgi:hypothetical protein
MHWLDLGIITTRCGGTRHDHLDAMEKYGALVCECRTFTGVNSSMVGCFRAYDTDRDRSIPTKWVRGEYLGP